ncbi:MAG: Rrf2 family transcriptional regulator [Phascolarctobacterium sp.]|nr:MAG: Rrf2 family transcriptional regulator [Phascolarctobacterium sp.]
MKISTKGRYALRLMLDLANNHQYGYTPVKEISLRQDISDKYLEQIISRLSKAGLVVSARGAQGGYKLAKAPADCTVGEILRVLEGDLAPVACAASDNPASCPRIDDCVTTEVWRRIGDAVNNVVDGLTLADLLKWQEQKCCAKKCR